MAGGKRKASVGLTRSSSITPKTHIENKRVPDHVHRQSASLGRAQNVFLIYVAVAAMSIAIWHTLMYVKLEINEYAAVWVCLYNNGSKRPTAAAGTISGDAEVPESFQMKLIAVYLAEEINITTYAPIYDSARIRNGNQRARRRDSAAASFNPLRSPIITPEMRARRVWTHAQCDPDGDGEIYDCDIDSV